MYSFAQRPDTKVVDEPLYGHYLRVSGAQHPGREEVLANMELEGDVVVKEFCSKDYQAPILFLKNMAHHLVSLDLAFLSKLEHVLLIRDPREMLPSLINQIPSPTMRDTGLKKQWELYQQLMDQGSSPIVIDSRELLLEPEFILNKVCAALQIPYYQEMIKWKPGALEEDGIWAGHWYHNVHKSTGFQEYKPKKDPIPENLKELSKQCEYFYHLLYEPALKATPSGIS
jgi:hypothetical protein